MGTTITDGTWPEGIPIDRMDPSALVGLDIPIDAQVALTVTGLPRALETAGVTVFTSARSTGTLFWGCARCPTCKGAQPA